VTFPHIDGELRDGRHYMQARVYYDFGVGVVGTGKSLRCNDFLCRSARWKQIHALYGRYSGVGRKLIGHPLGSRMNHDAVNEIAERFAAFWRIRFLGHGPMNFKDALAIDILELR
jgi:hypothetical protein